MIDVSDGLASELKHLSKANGLGLVIYDEKLPIDQETFSTARSFELDPTMCALNGGEDYELLFSILCFPISLLYNSKHPSTVSVFNRFRAIYITCSIIMCLLHFAQ